MNSFQFDIAKFAQTTACFSNSAVVAYIRLSCLYFSKASPISGDSKTIAKAVGVDVETVEWVLSSTFEQKEGQWSNSDFDRQIEKNRKRSEKAALSSMARWSKKKGLAQPTKKQKPQEQETDLQKICRTTWEAYKSAYFDRYGIAPVRNAKINAQVKAFCKTIPLDECDPVARFYVWSNDAFYVRKCHDFGLLVSDASKIRTEWATGHSVTGTRARQLEKSSTMRESAMEIIKEMGLDK